LLRDHQELTRVAVNFTSADDKTVRSWAYVIKEIASDEGQLLISGRRCMAQEFTLQISIACPYCGEKMMAKVGPPTGMAEAIRQTVKCLAYERDFEVSPPGPIVDGPLPI